jgi:hypothetical protein
MKILLEKERREARNRTLFMTVAFLVSILATYPASITLSDIFDLGIMRLHRFQVAPFPWLIWIVVAWFGKEIFVSGRKDYHRWQKLKNIVENFYNEDERLAGIRYIVRSNKVLAQDRQTATNKILIGCFLLLLEACANLWYLYRNAGGDFVLAGILALVPFSIFVVMAFLQGESEFKIRNLQEAYEWARTLPRPGIDYRAGLPDGPKVRL